MIVTEKRYVLQKVGNPIKFMGRDDRGYDKEVDSILEAVFAGNKETADVLLAEYNEKTLHCLAPDYRVVEVNVSYEF